MESISEPDDDSYFINVFGSARISFLVPQISETMMTSELIVPVGIHRHLDESQVLVGAMPSNSHEVAIDLQFLIDDKKTGVFIFLNLTVFGNMNISSVNR